MLSGLRRWIVRLEPAGRHRTVWKNYAEDNSYTDGETRHKRAFVTAFAQDLHGKTLWDIGCNNGDYAEAALAAGVGSVFGFDSDRSVLDLAFSRARTKGLDFLPLYLDAANPSPNQGWIQRERRGLAQRANADALLALALVHHLALGGNIPLPAVVHWLIDLAPEGVIEFVPKTDPMAEMLLQLREDVFEDYSEEAFVRALRKRASLVRVETVSASDRRLFQYKRS